MTSIIQVTSQVALWFSFFGGVICLVFYFRAKKSPRRNFRLFAAFILFYFAIIYLIALFGESLGDSLLVYLVRVGILTRMGVISLIGLLVGWVIAENGD